MNWSSFKPVEFEDQLYGQKDREFKEVMDLPSRVAPVVLEVAMAAGKDSSAPLDLLRHRGWTIADPDVVCPDLDSYRSYIHGSRAEFAVAKNGYVVGDSGWFSCRSACYLASGRPVVVQDTGFSDVLPVGVGLLSFSDIDGACDAIAELESDYERHGEAALEIAETYFDSNRILASLIERSMATVPARGLP